MCSATAFTSRAGLDCGFTRFHCPSTLGPFPPPPSRTSRRGHGLKFQVCTGASGLLEAVFGAMVGRKHDISLWRASGVPRDIDRLRATPILPAGQGDAEADNRWFAVGDSAYKGDRERVLIPHDRATPLTAAQQQFNKHLSRTRIAVSQPGRRGLNAWGRAGDDQSYTQQHHKQHRPIFVDGCSPRSHVSSRSHRHNRRWNGASATCTRSGTACATARRTA